MSGTREEIESWLKEMSITDYVINKDLTVDVNNNNVYISSKLLNNILIKFGIVNDNFDCSYNKLTNLKYCAEIINSNFSFLNNKLTNLEYFPKEINGKFIYMNENNIKEELVNFNCDIINTNKIYSDFNEERNKEEFLGKLDFYKNIKR